MFWVAVSGYRWMHGVTPMREGVERVCMCVLAPSSRTSRSPILAASLSGVSASALGAPIPHPSMLTPRSTTSRRLQHCVCTFLLKLLLLSLMEDGAGLHGTAGGRTRSDSMLVMRRSQCRHKPALCKPTLSIFITLPFVSQALPLQRTLQKQAPCRKQRHSTPNKSPWK